MSDRDRHGIMEIILLRDVTLYRLVSEQHAVPFFSGISPSSFPVRVLSFLQSILTLKQAYRAYVSLFPGSSLRAIIFSMSLMSPNGPFKGHHSLFSLPLLFRSGPSISHFLT